MDRVSGPIDFRDTQAAADYFGVTPRTISNWIRYGVPEIPKRLWLLRTGQDSNWKGIRFGDGELWLPDGTHQNVNQILMGPYWVRQSITETQRCTNLEARLRQAQAVTVASNECASFDKIARKVAGYT
ncbi:MAG: hypothetical protein V3U76_18495 [Granulosicoccus sp.]